ncbi:MAG: class I SAM-dependent methyltransferase [Rubrobacteraceae bacterium]
MRRNIRTDAKKVGEHYRDDSNLNVRMALHERFSANERPWHNRVFDHLELARGTTELWTRNADRIPQTRTITLTDAPPGMLQKAEENIKLNLNYTIIRNFRFILTEAQSLPFRDGGFDVVIANRMLYHIPDKERVFAEVGRVLGPGGVFYTSTNSEDNMKEMAAFRRILNPKYRVEDETSAFSLENGREQLAPWFSEVSLRKREDALVVTESGPLVDYLLSMMDAGEASERLSEEEFGGGASRLAGAVEEEIDAGGAVRITKSAGLFEARP